MRPVTCRRILNYHQLQAIYIMPYTGMNINDYTQGFT